MHLQTEKRFHNLTLEQLQTLDQVLTEVIPIHGRGNFPTLQVRAKDIIRVVKERLVERDIQVKDIRLNGASASHVLLRDAGLGSSHLDIIFGVELPRQEDFQVIKEVVLGSLRDLLPCGVNRRKITCLTMKEAYVQKMVRIFNEHDRWSLISLSNSRAQTVALRFVSALRRQFEFSVDSFQIILDRVLESYWETERRQGGNSTPNDPSLSQKPLGDEDSKREPLDAQLAEGGTERDSAMAAAGQTLSRHMAAAELEAEPPQAAPESPDGECDALSFKLGPQQDKDGIEDAHSDETVVVEPCEEKCPEKQLDCDGPASSPPKVPFGDVRSPHACLKVSSSEEPSQSAALPTHLTQGEGHRDAPPAHSPGLQDSQLELSYPPPAKKTCSSSQEVVADFCPSPKLQRKLSRKLISKTQWSLLPDLSELTTQLFPPIEIPKPLQPKPPPPDGAPATRSKAAGGSQDNSEDSDAIAAPAEGGGGPRQRADAAVKPKHSQKPRCSEAERLMAAELPARLCEAQQQKQQPAEAVSSNSCSFSSSITVEAECMFGDFEQAMDHLRRRLIATHNPEEIRGGGLLKYSDLLVRNFRPASETEIKSLERYMCSRFFIDFHDVGEQQRKIEAYLQGHFTGHQESSKYDYLMTLRRVIDQSTVCLMGHERRQTLNMITVLALRVLGEQNAIPNAANVTCFYQPAPYVAEPIYSGYFLPPPLPPPPPPPLLYQPYPLHVHLQSGLV